MEKASNHVEMSSMCRLGFFGENISTRRPSNSSCATEEAPAALEGKAVWTVVEEDRKASDRIGVENIDTKFRTTTLFGLPEATGVAMADVAAAKPVPDAANDDA